MNEPHSPQVTRSQHEGADDAVATVLAIIDGVRAGLEQCGIDVVMVEK